MATCSSSLENGPGSSAPGRTSRLYGAGNEKLGNIVWDDMPEDAQREYLQKNKARRINEKLLKELGTQSRNRIEKGLPALGQLVAAVREKAKAGFLRGLDGRLLEVRSEHSALNTLLQSAGALIMKRWLVTLDADLQAAGMVPLQWAPGGKGGHFEFVANVHDEAQTEVVDQYVTLYDELAVKAFNKAGEYYGFRCRIDGEGKSGTSWAETH